MRVSVALVLAAVASATPEPSKKKLLAIGRVEKEFWEAYQGRRSEAQQLYETPLLRAHTEPNFPQDARPDYSGLRSLYEDYDALQRQRGEAYLEFAKSGDPKATTTLFDGLLDAVKRADELDLALLDMEPGSRFDLRPGIERHGLDTRILGLETALAACPSAVAFLTGTAWDAAAKRDGKKSFGRRIAVLDALGMTRDPAATPFLAEAAKSSASSLRIAALEALIRLGPEATAVLCPLLSDKSPVVRFALLQAIRTTDAGDRSWVAPVYEGYRVSTKHARAEHVRTLEALSGRQYGDDPERWAAWYAKVEEAGGATKADLGKIDVEGTKRSETRDTFSFYGLATTTDRVVYVYDAGILYLPADADVQGTRCVSKWAPRSKGYWKEEWVDHATVLHAELLKSITGMAAETRFAVVALRGNNALDVVGGDKLLAPDAHGKRTVEDLLDRTGAPNHLGPWDGLIAAMRIAGLDPEPACGNFPEMKTDTVFLLNQGKCGWGCYWTADSTLRAFRRLNRFRRLQVNAVRICIPDKEEEALMQGFAEASGGSYKWQRKPP